MVKFLFYFVESLLYSFWETLVLGVMYLGRVPSLCCTFVEYRVLLFGDIGSCIISSPWFGSTFLYVMSCQTYVVSLSFVPLLSWYYDPYLFSYWWYFVASYPLILYRFPHVLGAYISVLHAHLLLFGQPVSCSYLYQILVSFSQNFMWFMWWLSNLDSLYCLPHNFSSGHPIATRLVST